MRGPNSRTIAYVSVALGIDSQRLRAVEPGLRGRHIVQEAVASRDCRDDTLRGGKGR